MLRLIMEDDVVIDIETASDDGTCPYRVVDANFGRLSDTTLQVHFLESEPVPGETLSFRSFDRLAETGMTIGQPHRWESPVLVERVMELTV